MEEAQSLYTSQTDSLKGMCVLFVSVSLCVQADTHVHVPTVLALASNLTQI